MTKRTKNNDESLLLWLSTWRQFIQNLEITEDTDLTDIDHQDIVVRGNLPRLIALLADKDFTGKLTKAYGPIHDKVGGPQAQETIRQFLMDACWLCQPRLNAAQKKTKNMGAADPGDAKKSMLALNKAALKLAQQIQDHSPSAIGPDSCTYLEERLQAGNPIGYIFKRKNSWQSALPQQPTRRLTELLRCFASDIEEEAALLSISIEGHRQKSGSQAGLHFAMDALAQASIALSTKTPAQPNFAIVNSVIATLLDPPNGFDSSTVRRRYLANQKRKTRT